MLQCDEIDRSTGEQWTEVLAFAKARPSGRRVAACSYARLCSRRDAPCAAGAGGREVCARHQHRTTVRASPVFVPVSAMHPAPAPAADRWCIKRPPRAAERGGRAAFEARRRADKDDSASASLSGESSAAAAAVKPLPPQPQRAMAPEPLPPAMDLLGATNHLQLPPQSPGAAADPFGLGSLNSWGTPPAATPAPAAPPAGAFGVAVAAPAFTPAPTPGRIAFSPAPAAFDPFAAAAPAAAAPPVSPPAFAAAGSATPVSIDFFAPAVAAQARTLSGSAAACDSCFLRRTRARRLRHWTAWRTCSTRCRRRRWRCRLLMRAAPQRQTRFGPSSVRASRQREPAPARARQPSRFAVCLSPRQARRRRRRRTRSRRLRSSASVGRVRSGRAEGAGLDVCSALKTTSSARPRSVDGTTCRSTRGHPGQALANATIAPCGSNR